MLVGLDKKIPKTQWNSEFINEMRPAAEKMLGEPIHSLPYSEFLKYYDSGIRVEYEQLYMEHRKRLYHFVAMALYEDDPKWTRGLCDALSAICGEFAWTFPAHADSSLSYTDLYEHIDLFAAETAHILAETLYLLSQRLPRQVVEMVKDNLMKRIVTPYLTKDHGWPKNNWQAVCNGCVAMTIIELGLSQVFDTVKDKIVEGLQVFLDSYPDDGICLEGPLYWTYGFGYFVHAASMLRDYTNGEIDLFKSEKVKNISHFYEYAFVFDEYTVPFADAGHILYLNPGLVGFLHREYGTPLISKKSATKYGYDLRWRFADMIRNFFWSEPFAENEEAKIEKYFPDAQWYYNSKNSYVLVAKGGNNDEPHNHNDIGSFVIFANGKYIVDDLGWPEYDKGYFDTSKRYKNYICASSFGHSVPIVNSEGQLFGSDKYGIVKDRSDGQFSIDLSLAYGLEEGSVKRKIECLDDRVILTDEAAEGKILTSRIAVRVEPLVDRGAVRIADAEITPLENCDIKITDTVFETHYSVAVSDTGRYVKAYFVDFIPKNGRKVELEIKIKNNGENK